MSLTMRRMNARSQSFLSPEEKEDESEERAEEDVADSPADFSPPSSANIYSCHWCKKSFSFKCRMSAHLRRCLMSPENQQQCPQCPAKLPSQRALKRHQFDAHCSTTQLKKKATCDLCARTFAHPSGQDPPSPTHTHKHTYGFDIKLWHHLVSFQG